MLSNRAEGQRANPILNDSNIHMNNCKVRDDELLNIDADGGNLPAEVKGYRNLNLP